MLIEYVKIKRFRNLVDFEISFSELKTVLIGQNASGKSNFLEALVLIFKQLDLIDREHDSELLFEFEIRYTCYGRKLKIVRQKDNNKYKYTFQKFIGKNVFNENEYEEIKKFKENRAEYLPKYIFAYYSGLGNSNRLEEHFEEHKAEFARQAMNASDNKVPDPARLLYAELIHSQLSLLSFFIDNQPDALAFLKDNLKIEFFQSVLLTVQKPDWSTERRMKTNKEYKFFGSSGVVKNLLYHLHDNVAFAPLRDTIIPKAGLWEKVKGKKGQEVVYLYIDNFEKIRKYVQQNGWTSFDFFHVLNTANVSQLLTKDGIKVRVKTKYADRILFRDLSEGEQQLLTVLGLMRFTITDEALFLLDEPDTHLNPLWRWKYMNFIDEIVLKGNITEDKKTEHSIQVIMSSHDPLTIGSLCKEEVKVFKFEENKVRAKNPTEDPKGMGAAGILTEIFELETTLDRETQLQLERRRHIESMLFNLQKNGIQLPQTENEEMLKSELAKLNSILDNLGFSRVTRDPLYQRFQAKFDYAMNYRKAKLEPLSDEEKERQEKLMEKILNELLDEEGA